MALMLRYLKLFNIQVLLACLAAILLYKILPRALVSVAVDFVIKVHQIPIIPYIIVSLIVGVGSIDKADLVRYIKRFIGFTLMLWFISVIVVLFMSWSYRPIDHNLNIRDVIDHLKLSDIVGMNYVSDLSRYFSSMLIPALCIVILFFAVSLTYMENRSRLIDPLNIIREIFESLFDWFLTLLPLSIFILLVHALSVFNIEQFSQLTHHLLTVASFSLVFVFVVFPMILYYLCHVPYRQTLKTAMPCLWLTLLAGDCVLALPIIVRSLKSLFRKQGIKFHDSLVGFLVPIAFSIPLVGSIGNLLFVYFASVFYGISLNMMMYFKLAFIGTFTMFAEPLISVPLMIEILHIPHDAVPLFMLVSTFTDILFDTCETFSMIVLVCLVIAPPRKYASMFARINVTMGVALFALLLLTPAIFFLRAYDIGETLLHNHPGVALKGDVHSHVETGDVFSRIQKTNTLRIGIVKDLYPFCFTENGVVNGYEVDLTRKLAKDLHVKPEYQRVDNAQSALHSNQVDLVICQGQIGQKLPEGVLLTQPVLDTPYKIVGRQGMTSKDKSAVQMSGSDYKKLSLDHESYADRDVLVPDIFLPNVLNQNKHIIQKGVSSQRYVVSWVVEPSALQLLQFLNQWIISVKISNQYQPLLSHWFSHEIKSK